MKHAFAKPSAAVPEPAANDGYRKGEEARHRILEAALKAFGAHGFAGATTRQIAEDAGVNLPALKYYFGGKEGLYTACAREIVSRYEKRMLTQLAQIYAALSADMKPTDARARLKEVVDALAAMMIGTDETQAWASFVLREMTERGPAFAILYDQLWAPGVELTAMLIARIMGERAPSQASRIQALLLISSLSAFSTARPVALKYLEWPDTGEKRFARVMHIVHQQIDRIG